MIIDDSVSFFGIYYHNCILNLNLSKEFYDLYSKVKYRKVILCQKDNKNNYLLTESISEEGNSSPNIKSYYFLGKKMLLEQYNELNKTVDSYEKIFYLLISDNNNSFKNNENLIQKWKKEVKEYCK